MRTREELTERISFLQAESTAMAAELFEALNAAIDAYFERNEDFKEQARETFDAMLSDLIHAEMKFDDMNLIPQASTDYPKGYNDIRDLFDGDGAFDEIMEIDIDIFKAAFIVTTPESDNGESSEPEVHNTYLETWTATILAAIDKELEELKRLKGFCECRADCVRHASFFEGLGFNGMDRAEYSVSPEDYAKEIYIKRGYDWFADCFNFELYRPSYIDKLRVVDSDG